MISSYVLTALKRDGIAEVPGLTPVQVDTISDHLAGCPTYAGHVKREGTPRTWQSICCWDMHDLIVAPFFWEWALTFTPLAESYVDAPPVLYSMNVFESAPSDLPPHPGIEVFHRDRDDVRFLALFVYLTDVRSGDGSHLYQCGTQDGGRATRISEITGPRGTAFLADTRGFHMGIRPRSSPRRIAWARWGVSDPPPSYVRDQLRPLPRERLGARYPASASLRHAVRLVVA